MTTILAREPDGWRSASPAGFRNPVFVDVSGETLDNVGFRGEMAEWLMAADCKSALLRVRWFESSSLHQAVLAFAGVGSCGSSSMVERQPSKLHTTVRSRSPAPVFALVAQW